MVLASSWGIVTKSRPVSSTQRPLPLPSSSPFTNTDRGDRSVTMTRWLVRPVFGCHLKPQLPGVADGGIRDVRQAADRVRDVATGSDMRRHVESAVTEPEQHVTKALSGGSGRSRPGRRCHSRRVGAPSAGERNRSPILPRSARGNTRPGTAGQMRRDCRLSSMVTFLVLR